MSDSSSINPFNIITNFFSASPHSRLSGSLASIHHHVSQELEPDFYAEWERGRPQRHRSDTTKSSSSSLFSNMSHEPITSRMYSALEDNKIGSQPTLHEVKDPVKEEMSQPKQGVVIPTIPVRKGGWNWAALNTIQVHTQSMSIPIDPEHAATPEIQSTSK